MAHLFQLEPEVAGSLGPKTIITNRPQIEAGNTIIPDVAHVEYHFEGWLGDDILEASPCYIISDLLAAAMGKIGLTGFRLEAIDVSTSDNFDRFQSKLVNWALPIFLRLVPDGQVEIQRGDEVVYWSGDDICWGTRIDWIRPTTSELIMTSPPPYALVVTERGLNVIREFNIENCDVTPLEELQS